MWEVWQAENERNSSMKWDFFSDKVSNLKVLKNNNLILEDKLWLKPKIDIIMETFFHR